MKRRSYRSYILLAILLLGCLNLPITLIQSFRSKIVSLSSLPWKWLASSTSSINPQKSLQMKIEKLLAEKGELSRQNERLKRRVKAEERGLEPSFVFAQVIYREPSSWNSSIWIDVGEENSTVQVNSPVLSGNALIGIVEVVGKKQSCVRLLTDASLVVSVRAIRGDMQQRKIIQLIDQLSLQLSLNAEKKLSVEDEKILFEKLGDLKHQLQTEAETQYLAKGEVFGTSFPLWRSRSSTLKGEGFNYDFEDDKGPARELRTGKPYGHFFEDGGIKLIQEGDLLVTTGMDGLFPSNIPVAIVSKVYPLKEGAASFSIEAKLFGQQIEDLVAVMVLPSLGMNFD